MAEDRNIFRQFVSEMDSMLRETEKVDDRNQESLLNDLFVLEATFKNTLLSDESGRELYKKFMDFILTDKGNILSARVYFRERQETFSNKLFSAFHKKRSNMLHKFKINYLFAQWCLGKEQVVDKKGRPRRATYRYQGPHRKPLTAVLQQIIELRKILCQNNLPLAINRAKIFWSKVPESHMQYMDMIQASNEGLMNAIDKFVPPYKKVFNSTAIGRMKLNMITDYNDTLVKIPPKEKRILYRANTAKRYNITKNEEVVDYVRESFEGVTQSELADIEAAASQIMDIHEKPEGSHSLSEKLSDVKDDIEAGALGREVRVQMKKGLKSLKVIEKKVVYLKNGDL